jgi:hypothetical protein
VHPTRAPDAHFAALFSERPGARGRDDLDYAMLAAEYVAVLHEPSPIEALKRRTRIAGKKRLQNLLTEARNREVLTRPRPGRAEGELTPYGKKLLKEAGYGTR